MNVLPSLLWFRRDLRLQDHPALQRALEEKSPILPVYILPPKEGKNGMGQAQRAYLYHSLLKLKKSLQKLGSDLYVFEGLAQDVLPALASHFKTTQIGCAQSSDPGCWDEQIQVEKELGRHNVHLVAYGNPWIVAPNQVLNQANRPYRVFTPFWRAARSTLTFHTKELSFPISAFPIPKTWQSSDFPSLYQPLSHDQWNLCPSLKWDAHFWDQAVPGEEGAWEMLDAFLDGALHGYAKSRDFPDQIGTSRFSHHLALGEIHPHRLIVEVWQYLQRHPTLQEDVETFLKELGWREFARHLFVQNPNLNQEEFEPNGVQWKEIDPGLEQAWQQGQTGIPMIDAAMRELWQTGWMHNRSRMMVADYWCKHLGYDWRIGAKWFKDTLIDWDLANNTLGWQWAAGTGADAAPYYRIFNPILQGQKFDPKGKYRYKYMPELKSLTVKQMDEPWKWMEILPSSYPTQPIVHPSVGRSQALQAWANRHPV